MIKNKIAFLITIILNLAVAISLALGSPFYVPSLKRSLRSLRKSSSIKKRTHSTRFFKALAYKESGLKYHKINKFGYLGKYQFGESALIGLGYYNKDGSKKNDWKGKWTGKFGIFSKHDFLNSALVQEIAVHELAMDNWKVAKSYKLHKSVGKKLHGIRITKEGILAAMHLKGPLSVNKFIFQGINSTDALGTGVQKYMHLFSDYEKLILRKYSI